MQEKHPPTIRDVAKRAGVSAITVSRVVNNSGYVGQETRERVEAAIAELGYVPNTLARSLRSRSTNALALILTDITNPFWTTVGRGVEDTANEAGFTVILGNTDESEIKQEKYLRTVVKQQVDGVLLVPASRSADPILFIQEHNTPVVVLDRRVDCDAVDVVRVDSEEGAYQLVRLLLEQGHRRIAALSGPVGISTSEDRIAGYRRALAEAGLSPDDEIVITGGYSQQSGYEMTHRALKMDPRPTALFTGNNFIGLGALRALREAELRVPEDISLVSFDDQLPDFSVQPFLTVVAQPAYEIGRRATELLLSRLSGAAPAAYQEIVLQTELIIRESIRPAPAATGQKAETATRPAWRPRQVR